MCQSAGLPWTVAKGQDTFTPISSVVRNELYFFNSSLSADIVLNWIRSYLRSNSALSTCGVEKLLILFYIYELEWSGQKTHKTGFLKHLFCIGC